MPAVTIDPKLSGLAARCVPDGCPRGYSCCVGNVIEVSRREMHAIDAVMDELAATAPWLRDGDAYVNAFTDDGDGWEIEPRDEDGTCPFLFERDARMLCAIHATALRTGRDVAAVKPRACRHFPLVLAPHRGGLHVTIHPRARRMGCVAPVAELPGQPTVRDAFASEIEEIRRLANAQP
jgi:Fe-S-cluster containining protein